jgi:hypothetical protein
MMADLLYISGLCVMMYDMIVVCLLRVGHYMDTGLATTGRIMPRLKIAKVNISDILKPEAGQVDY